MTDFLIYQVKVAVALAVFYMFYRLLLSKDTFHRFNRIVLTGTAVLSFILPFCIITIRKTVTLPAPVQQSDNLPAIFSSGNVLPSVEPSTPWWTTALCILFVAGALCIIIHSVISVIRIRQIIRNGECIELESGEKLIIADSDTAPFSWMKYIVISREDYESGYTQILTHEKAHIALRHSYDILLVDIITSLQWFNPAIWMLKSDLRAIHEFEADEAVLLSGANIKEYQYLLIRKAVSKSGYSVANSFNHSTLKQRITMMSNKKSSRMSAWKALYVIPLVGISLAATAETKVDYQYEGQQPEAVADTLVGKDKKTFREKNLKEGHFIIDEEARSITMVYYDHEGKELRSTVKGLDLNSDIYFCNGNLATPKAFEKRMQNEDVVILNAYMNNGKKVRGAVVPDNDYVSGIWDVNKSFDEQETFYHRDGKVYRVSGGKYVEIEGIKIRERDNNGNDVEVSPSDVLYVIDGEIMPEGFDLNIIDHSTIESINVLQNEDAINKYGDSRAVKGAVEVWLKREKSHDPDEVVRFIPVSEPVGDPKEYYGFKLYDADNWNEKISYKKYKSIPDNDISYLFIEHISGGKRILHIYTTDYNTAVHLTKSKKTTDINDPALDWVNEKTQILVDGKWENYEGYQRTGKFRSDDIEIIEYHKYPERKIKRLGLANNGFVSILYKKDYSKEITLNM